jgi:glycerol-3-phosphate O-acyltransferase
MLAMTVRGFLRARQRPVVFQPLYIGFERMAEGHVYTAELSGEPKKSESLRDFFSALKMLKRNYGKVHVSFGEPIYLENLLDSHAPQWQANADDAIKRPEWMPALLEDLSTRIMSGINGCADVNPVNLLAMALLATRKHAIDRNDLVEQINLFIKLLRQTPLAPRVTITDLNAGEIIDYGIELGIVSRSDHKLGEIITTTTEDAVLLTYFRNNVAHLFAAPSFIACGFLNRQRLGRKRLERLFTLAYPYLKAELFLPWDEETALETLRQHLDQHLDHLVKLGLLREEQNGAMLLRAQGSSNEAIQLRLLGHGLLQTFERYYITVAVLVKNGNGTLSNAQLEKLCGLTAQRLSILHEFEAPEFYDKNLLKTCSGISSPYCGKMAYSSATASASWSLMKCWSRWSKRPSWS